MITFDEIQKVAQRPERSENAVLTLYLNVDQSEQANQNRGFEKHLKDLLADIRTTIQQDVERKNFETASRRLEEFVDTYDLGARGLGVIFDTFDGFKWSAELDFPVRNLIRWTTKAVLLPLVVALDEYQRFGIVLLDRAHLRLFTMISGDIEEHISEGFNRKNVRHIKTVGMDHLSSAGRAQRRADEQIAMNLRHAAKDIGLVFEQHGIQRIILAGSAEITAELQKTLPKRLASRVIGRVELPAIATLQQVRDEASTIAEKFELEAEQALVSDLVTSAAKSSRVVTGLGHTLHAVNQRRVWNLVYAEGFHSSGFECSGCRALFSMDVSSCPLCGAAANPVDDVVERAVDRAIGKGARIEVIRGEEAESSLLNAGGIGAFLRTRTAA